MKTVLNRRVGCEFEGYVTENPRSFNTSNAEKKGDGSLRNGDWYDQYAYWGVEIACNPTNNIEKLWRTFEELESHGWFTDNSAGTHVHVEAPDLSLEERAKLMMFTTDIQEAAFLFVDNDRFGNRYCRMNSKGWANVFNKSIFPRLSFEPDPTRRQYSSSELAYLINHFGYYGNQNISAISRAGDSTILFCNKYNWINVMTRFPTVEFRLFNGIQNKDQILNFTNIAVGIVDLVKNSTVEQLKFIAYEIMNNDEIFIIAKKFLEAIGIDWEIPVVSNRAVEELALMDVEQRLGALMTQ
jgi:hypothetical protein